MIKFWVFLKFFIWFHNFIYLFLKMMLFANWGIFFSVGMTYQVYVWGKQIASNKTTGPCHVPDKLPAFEGKRAETWACNLNGKKKWRLKASQCFYFLSQWDTRFSFMTKQKGGKGKLRSNIPWSSPDNLRHKWIRLMYVLFVLGNVAKRKHMDKQSSRSRRASIKLGYLNINNK